MNEEKGYVDLLQRVTDIYSGALGQEWNDDEHIIGAEELAVIIPAVLDRLFPKRPEWFRKPGFFMRNFGSPEECAHWLWLVKYEKEADPQSFIHPDRYKIAITHRHDRSAECPVDPNDFVIVQRDRAGYVFTDVASEVPWERIIGYSIFDVVPLQEDHDET